MVSSLLTFYSRQFTIYISKFDGLCVFVLRVVGAFNSRLVFRFLSCDTLLLKNYFIHFWFWYILTFLSLQAVCDFNSWLMFCFLSFFWHFPFVSLLYTFLILIYFVFSFSLNRKGVFNNWLVYCFLSCDIFLLSIYSLLSKFDGLCLFFLFGHRVNLVAEWRCISYLVTFSSCQFTLFVSKVDGLCLFFLFEQWVNLMAELRCISYLVTFSSCQFTLYVSEFYGLCLVFLLSGSGRIYLLTDVSFPILWQFAFDNLLYTLLNLNCLFFVLSGSGCI